MSDQFNYRRRPAQHELAPVTLKTRRFATGAAGKPNDVKTGFGGDVWFTGSANAIGRLDDKHRLTVFQRKVGHAPTVMREDEQAPGYERGFRFIDPVGRRIGFFDHGGQLYDEIELEPAITPTGIGLGAGLRRYSLIGTNAGLVIDAAGNRRIKARDEIIDALGWFDDCIWQISGSRLRTLYPGYETGGRTLELAGAARVSCMVEGGPLAPLIYVDPGRNIIGFIESWRDVLEVELPAGADVRSIAAFGASTIWFTGRGGVSLFRLDRMRTAIEYRCAAADSDLAGLDFGHNCLWFTEPRHSAITFADVTGF